MRAAWIEPRYQPRLNTAQSCRSLYSRDVALQLGIGDIRCKLGFTEMQSYFMMFLPNMVVFHGQYL